MMLENTVFTGQLYIVCPIDPRGSCHYTGRRLSGPVSAEEPRGAPRKTAEAQVDPIAAYCCL